MTTTADTTTEHFTTFIRSVQSTFDQEHLSKYWTFARGASIAPIKIIGVVSTFICVVVVYLLLKYRTQIKRQIQAIDQHVSRGLVYRDCSSSTSSTDNKQRRKRKIVKCLELSPEFVQQHPDWQLCSLGEYLNTLRFFTEEGLKQNDDEDDGEDDDKANGARDMQQSKLSNAVEREIHVAMGSAILSSFGPNIGGALLPLLGIKPVESIMSMLFSKFLSWVVANIFVDFGTDWDPIGDLAAMPFNVSELISFVNLNQKFRQPGQNREEQEQKDRKEKEMVLLEEMKRNSCTIKSNDAADVATSSTASSCALAPLEWMDRGEVAYDPTYYTPSSPANKANDEKMSDNPDEKVLIPNPFVVEDHFEAAISGLEERIRHQQKQKQEASNTGVSNNDDLNSSSTEYDPNDTSLPTPTPVNEHILPGLHLGWGNAKCTHTKREILRNRLFAVIMTKLSHNYNCRRQDMDRNKYFVVRYNGKKCTFPDEFIQCLLETGHEIEVCPRSTITTFGLALCVKEDDGSWTNVPMAFFFRSGYERLNRRPVYFTCPHGGVDLVIKGPLVGPNNKCNIQFYMAIEGMCGWHSNHNADVPWIRPVATTELYTKHDAITAIRMSGLLACAFNAIGTELKLPFGGYGVLGVCNDTAAFVDCAVRGSTNMYPLLSTGRFLLHTSAHLMEMKNKLSAHDDVKDAASDAHRLAAAACQMESDLHCAPINLLGATRRYLANFPVSYFQIMEDSREEMKKISMDYKKFEEGRLDQDPIKRLSANKFVDFLTGKGI